VEALVRWRHPRLGILQPSEFIPLAEECGIIAAIDEWVLSQACAQARAWELEGLPRVRMAVNMSSAQLHRPGLLAAVAGVLDDTGLDPDYLELELTETAAMQDPDQVGEVLRRLRRSGVRLAIDDFGTGYSIWGYLKTFPVGRLKIDRSFVSGLPSDRHDSAIVCATLEMAHQVGMEVTAEGVETETQAAFLLERGCELLQGFLYAEPLPPEGLAEMLRAQAARSEMAEPASA
jgi:EAL domain-containing protein (putative c-di-GMP-specific phosphodiesterase class I)